MAEITRASLFGKLTPLGFRTLESATVFCKLRGNPRVEITHWLHQILQETDSDLLRIVRHFALDPALLAADLTQALEKLPRGNGGSVELASELDLAMERAWLYTSLLFGSPQVRSGYLLVGLLKTPELRRRLATLSRQFERIAPDTLAEVLADIGKGSPEDSGEPLPGSEAQPGEASNALGMAPQAHQALARYTVDLTEEARQGKLDPVTGRDAEIRQVIDILMRRRQNNPILTGEAGVGKTAVVEGFALRIAQGDVPPALARVRVRVLDIGLLTAGASMKGEFEQRLRQVIDEVHNAHEPIILFIDEAHTLMGAGGNAGTGDAANLLKPALARGKLRTIAATTWAEYKKYIEKDPALTRRFQPVAVAEPAEQQAIRMLRGLAPHLERHHGVRILEEALAAAVQLSQRYIPDRQLPDKAISLLDTVCARVAVSQHATPSALEDQRSLIEALEAEQTALAREAETASAEHAQRLTQRIDDARTACRTLDARWQEERALVEDIRRQCAALDNAESADGARETIVRQRQTLSALQGEAPLVLDQVDAATVARVVQDWTGIPVGRMVKREIDLLLSLDTALSARIVGQDHALAAIARRIQTARAGIDLPNRPVGVFLLAGPSGVGKTETAKALADILYGGERNLITVNLSEYQEAHTVSTLKGAPPGYVGYGQGGVLTEAVRRRPYSVLLLDEVEKAHPDVHEIFYQVFDQGWMEDGEGRVIDFKNTLILLTSNVGAEAIAAVAPDPAAMRSALAAPLARVFPAALIGRMTAIAYAPLAHDTLSDIARLQLAKIADRLRQQAIELSFSDAVVDTVLARCNQSDSGARQIQSVLMQEIMPEIGLAVLRGKRDGRGIRSVHVAVEEHGFGYRFE
ncbi:type VI secretion system ATPase TssH [Paludibacterium purpuratum]|uniref:Type VI secretion system protein VasG n=1 Tax=Paludibacterium purpuratum TaxID=1144873 RepID=A0A4R7B5Q8_9NEIS|nr:type VI secretion system ATPase TssH [Paludibacterium purpuratum]TDR78364.1 type VI secretion system protein VasG [Paludibacterium purpuratum]